MAATQALVEAVGPYKVDDEGAFTKAVLTELLAKAKEMLDLDNPGFSTALYDLAHAYLVLHLFVVKMGSAGMKSESLGDYSYTRDVAGDTTWLIIYKQLIDQSARKGMSSGDELDGVERIDKYSPESDMDQSDLMEFED